MLSRILLAAGLIFVTSLAGSKAEVTDEKVLGDPTARVTIIEFASLSCPHCAEFHKTRFDWLKENYIDTGKVRFVFRDFPLNRPALLGSMVAHCAEPSKYFAYLSLLFKNQEKWAFSQPVEEQLAKLARVSGMGQEKLSNCLEDEALAERIIQSRLESQNTYNIESTPSFLVGDQLIVGVPSEERLRELIEGVGQ
ncbi:MAG: DsbA family protein [Pseudomonadota bacterium]|nr:DsbA family protein [Pseudomonadota bacterium]